MKDASAADEFAGDALVHLARAGLMEKRQLAAAYAYGVWRGTGALPPAKTLPLAVKRRYGHSGRVMSRTAAYAALAALRKTLPGE